MLTKARTVVLMLVAGAALALPVMGARAAPLPMTAAGAASADLTTEVAKRSRYGGHYRGRRYVAPRRAYRRGDYRRYGRPGHYRRPGYVAPYGGIPANPSRGWQPHGSTGYR